MSANKPDIKGTWVDPDDAPELTDAWFEGADIHEGGVLIRRGRGRPKVARPKQQITLRLDADIIERFRATGPGWQARINEALRKAG
ncbi:MAG TPA: BrnA antitoxin family protein [Bosea sp. (in: a-proteobacteria)]